MRVVGVCDYLPVATCGGAERVAREVYQRLVRDHRVDLVAIGAVPARHPVASLARSQPARVDMRGFPAVVVDGLDLSSILGVQLTIAPQMRSALTDLVMGYRPDVIHAHGLQFHSTVVAAGVARKLNVPMVVTAHIGGAAALPRLSRTALASWDRTMARRVLHSSEAAIAVSPSVGRYMDRLTGGEVPVVLAPNGVDHNVFHAEGRRSRQGGLRVGFVGRLIANKGPELVLQAIELLHRRGTEASVDFIGEGPLRGALQRRVSDKGLAGSVCFHGQVDDVASRLRNLDVVARPSLTEGLPLGVLEAMACGTVVVSSSVPGNLDLVQPGKTGLAIAPRDPKGLADALEALAGDRELLLRLQRNGVELASRYTWAESASVHHNVLAEAGAHRTATRGTIPS